MEYINEINSYNKISLNSTFHKDKCNATFYNTSKIRLDNDIISIKQPERNPFKWMIDLNKHPQIPLEEKVQVNSNSNSNNNSNSNIDNNKLNNLIVKDEKSVNIKPRVFTTENSSTNTKETNNSTIKNLKKPGIPLEETHNSETELKKEAVKSPLISLLNQADPLPKRSVVPKVHPKFGKMRQYFPLPDFVGVEPLTKLEFKPLLKEFIQNPQIERQYEVSLYVNSSKMINNLVYLKTNLSKEGLIILENYVNVKKLNKNEYEENSNAFLNFDSKSNDNYKSEKKEGASTQEVGNSGERSFNSYPLKRNSTQNPNNAKNKSNESVFCNTQANVKSNDEIAGESEKNLNLSMNIKEKIMDKKDCLLSQSYSNNVHNRELRPYYSLKSPQDKTLLFESRFESGNLLCAFKTETENNYQLYLQNDTNTTGYIQWFFFQVKNTSKNKVVNFNIINMLRKTCVYSQGLKVMVYSMEKMKKEGVGWHRDGENVMYYPNNLYVYNENNDRRRNLYSLSFDYKFKYSNDTVYFANCIPYFYSSLMKELSKLELDESTFPFFHRKTLTSTLGGNDLDMFTINSYYDIYKKGIQNIVYPKQIKNKKNVSKIIKNKFIDRRKAVILIARQHPGETVGSHVIKGAYDFLLGASEEAKKLREIYLFKIVPMMNPDGMAPMK